MRDLHYHTGCRHRAATGSILAAVEFLRKRALRGIDSPCGVLSLDPLPLPLEVLPREPRLLHDLYPEKQCSQAADGHSQHLQARAYPDLRIDLRTRSLRWRLGRRGAQASHMESCGSPRRRRRGLPRGIPRRSGPACAPDGGRTQAAQGRLSGCTGGSRRRCGWTCRQRAGESRARRGCSQVERTLPAATHMTELRPKSTPTPSEAMQSCSEGRWRLSCRWAPSSTPTFWKIAASENPAMSVGGPMRCFS